MSSDTSSPSTTDTTNGDDEAKPSLWKRLRARRSTRWTMDIALVVVVIALITSFQSRHLLSGEDPLPPAQLEALDGSTLEVHDLDADRTIVYFWTTWCGVCDVQSGAVSSMYERAQDDDDLEVISVALHYESADQIAHFVEEEEIDYPVYLGTDSVAQRYNVTSFPTIYIIDDEHRVRHGLVGYTTRWGLQFRLWW